MHARLTLIGIFTVYLKKGKLYVTGNNVFQLMISNKKPINVAVAQSVVALRY
jgi:hypothetical protein